MATIETTYDNKNDLTTHTIEGTFSLKEAMEKIEEIYPENFTEKSLWDFTNADISKITSSEYWQIAKKAREYAHLREGGMTAFVLPKDVSYGLGRMFETLAEIENIPYKVRAFRDISGAREWLGV